MNHSGHADNTEVYFQDSIEREQAATRRSIMVATSTVVDGLPDEQKTSPVRRVFCLLCLFDLICIFIIWVIYVRLVSDDITEAFSKQVVDFRIQSSMFDIMLLALVRLLIQEIAYGIVRAQKPWWTALSTTITCIYLLIKIFYYDFKHAKYNKGSTNLIDYLLMLASFVICWVETWVLDFRVLPREKAARQLTEETTSLIDTQSGPHERRYMTFGNERFFSPTSSTPVASSRYMTAYPSTRQSISGSPVNSAANNYSEVQPLLLKASETFDQACSLFSNGQEWTHEKGDAIQGCVYSRQLAKKTRIYKLEVLLPITPERLFRDFVEKIEETASWNPSVAELRRVQKLSADVDVIYSVSTEQLKGVISPRDCVNIRKWSQISHRLFLIGEQSVEHSLCPPDRRYVRATNGIGYMAFEEVVGMPGQCKFTWVLNTNIKGWLPSSVVEQAMTTVMFAYSDIIRHRVDHILGVS